MCCCTQSVFILNIVMNFEESRIMCMHVHVDLPNSGLVLVASGELVNALNSSN